ncbi:MAG TPA: UvrD-helicase domain-containing protein [Nitrospirota bacterium]|nr:UvrD-helicase domain-containing protein [Nitrospirota bacterium]
MTSNPNNQTHARAADTGKSVHLSASAGSGKTRALKDRYLALLDVLDNRGLNIDQAVAITFTEKAAAEIKERVMSDLSEAMLKKIVRGRQDLRISTIHSFCMNLLKRYPLEAGLPPDFGVLDARDQVYKIQKAIEDTLEESDREPGIMAPLRDFTADELVAMIGFLLSVRSRLKRMEIDAGGPPGLLRSVSTGMGIDAAEAELKAFVGSPEWKAVFMQMELLLRTQDDQYENCMGSKHTSLATAKDAQTAYREAGSLMTVYFTQREEARKKPLIGKTRYRPNKTFPYAAYETLYSQVQNTLSRFMTGFRHAQAGYEAIGLLQLYERSEARYQESKLREGLLDFDDLEIYAYRLLQKPESLDILYWLDRKILHFLVDEFQDTSDIQWAILNKLTEEIFAGQGADKPMRPTLFVVGDEKQSIYRFREANYRLIENVQEKMEKNILSGSREILTLDRNFRSTPKIIEIVNLVFATLWGAQYTPSEADRKQHTGSVRLIELPLSSTEEGPASPTEAEILAQEIRNVATNKTIIYEKDSDGWKERQADYGDCAVLIQSRTRLKEYEAALQSENIPFRVVGGIGFYEEDEIQAILNVLFFLWNEDDKLAFIAALKSPLFGMTDKDIFDLLENRGSLADSLRRHHPDAAKLLDNWKRYASTEPLAGLIHRLIQDSGAYIRFGRRNQQAIFNLDKLLDTARDFDRRGYTTLQDFVEWVKNIRAAEQREATADMNLPGLQGAVNIMTVHKAKGLEFPVVFLPGMNQQPKSVSTGPRAIIEDNSGGVRMAIKDSANPVYDEMWEREREELRREHQRLLYVAMTRARDHLIMIGSLANGKTPYKQNSWLSWLHEAKPKPLFDAKDISQPGSILYAYPDSASVRAKGEAISACKTEAVASRAEKIDEEALIKNLSPIPRSDSLEWKRATAFIEQKKEDELREPSLKGEGSSISPLTRGNVLHRCLEDFTKTVKYDLSRIIREFPDIETAKKEVKNLFIHDANSVLQAVLARKEFAWIFERGPGAYSELPFLYKRGRSLISGIMDRVVIKDRKGFVIDYKAILIENEGALTAWKDHYRPQLNIYCEAVKEIFKLENVEGYLLFLDSNRLELTAKT